MKVLTVLLFIFACQASGDVRKYCYADDLNPYLYFGPKTSYDNVRGQNTLRSHIPNCEPVQIWMLARHATRYCSKETSTKFFILPELRDRIVNNHEKLGRGQLCKKDLQNLKNWDIYRYLHLIGSHEVSIQGFFDTMSFAQRLSTTYPTLISPDVQDMTSKNYKFRTSKTNRSNVTMYAFIEGLFDNNFVLENPEVYINNTLLRIEENCPVWKEESATEAFKTEEYKFIAGPEMYNLVQSVKRRLGFTEDEITYETVLSIYTACRYDVAWYPSNNSAWCAVFTKDDIQVLEYREDLDYYYYCGNGRSLSKHIGCSPLQDMFEHFRNLEEGNAQNEPKGIFYFTHSVGLHMLIALLGIKNDDVPITASNYRFTKERRFRTSVFGAFSANIMAVFYKCKDANSPNKVMLYLSEEPVTMDGCQDGLCDWEFLKEKFGSAAFNCNLDACFKRNTENSGFVIRTITWEKIILFSVILLLVT